MSKAERLAQALDDLLGVSPEVEAAAVVSADGLPMASALPPHVEEERLAAMSAALLTLGDRAAEGLGKGQLQQVFIEGSDGHVILMSAGRDAVLVSVVSHGAKIGLVLYEMRRSAATVAEVMDSKGETPAAESPPEMPAPDMPAPAPDMPAPAPVYQEMANAGFDPDPYASQFGVRPPEPTPAAEVVQPSVSVWE